MQIIWKGKNNIKIISETNTILVNPEKAEACSIVVDAKNVDDFKKMNNLFTVVNYGEYEVKDDFIYKNLVEQKDGEKKDIYRIDIEGVNMLNLNNISKELNLQEDEESLENIVEGNFDVLFIPIGEGFLDAKTAIDIKDNLSPRIVIPINYDPIKDEKALKEFRSIIFKCYRG